LNCFSTPFRKSWEGEGRFLFFLGQNPLPHPIKLFRSFKVSASHYPADLCRVIP
jgi:hypothetical protein